MFTENMNPLDFIQTICDDKTGKNLAFDIRGNYGAEVKDLLWLNDAGAFIVGLMSDYKITGLNNGVLKIEVDNYDKEVLKRYSKALKIYGLKLGVKKINS